MAEAFNPRKLIVIVIVGGVLVGAAFGFAQWWQEYQNRAVAEHHDRIFKNASDALDRVEAKRAEERQRMMDLVDTGAFNTKDLRIDAALLRDAGPPKDAVAAITGPTLVSADEANLIDGDERVIGVVHGGEARAYPVSILNLHQIINDELGGDPIAVSFCPLCDSVVVVHREVDGATVEFGVSGKLLYSNMLMFDRTDDALWSPMRMEALSGPHAGTPLRPINTWSITTLAAWVEAHPTTTIVAPPPASDLNYAMNPYKAYLASDRVMDRFAPETLDNRLPAKQRIVGLRLGDAIVACTLESIRAAGGERTITVAGQPIVLRSPASNGVEVVSAPEDARVVHTFWFAWAALYPETQIAD